MPLLGVGLMLTRIAGLLLAFVSLASHAEVAVFSRAPNANAPIRDVQSSAVIADYAVAPNIRRLAENLVRDNPAPLVFALPGQAAVRLDVKRFEPIDGFEFDEHQLRLRVVPGARDSDLSFTVYGVRRGAELSLTVRKGLFTGSLTGPFKRRGQA